MTSPARRVDDRRVIARGSGRTRWIIALATLALGLMVAPSSAMAYLMDANDAKVVDPGTLEFELQPVGYYNVLSEPDAHYLIAPSLMGYVGITADADFIFLTRGYVYLGEDPEETRYRTWESMVGFRFLLARGRYSTEGAEGPSIVLQAQLMVPNLEGQYDGVREQPGAGAAILLGQTWDVGTLHANVWSTLTTWRSYELFVAAAMEGPPDWSVRPLVEVTYVHDTYYGDLLSGTVGTYIDANDDLSFELGARLGGWEDYAELEVRVSMWIDAPLGAYRGQSEEEAEEGAGDSGDPADGDPAQEARERRSRTRTARASRARFGASF